MQKIIIGNWKMNPSTLEEAQALFDAIKNGIGKNSNVVICPPYVYLPLLKGLTLGAQNVSDKEKGAFTTQISAAILKDLGVKYVLVGHSESRQYLKETNEIINEKIKECLRVGLKPILCIGEDDGEDKIKVLESEITEALGGISEEQLKDIIIAYEPIFAVGTGKNCSIEETKTSVGIIKDCLAKIYTQNVADQMRIIYGGSVNSQNAKEYLENANVQGLLPGGASLKPEEFIKIVESV